MIRSRILVALLLTMPGVCPTHASESVHTIVLTGQSAPGTGPNVVFSAIINDPVFRFSFINVDLNNQGHVAFHAYLAGDEEDSSATGIWRYLGGDLTLVARTNEAAPGFSGRKFRGFTPPVLHDNGDVAVLGYLTEPPQACPRGGACHPTEYGLWTQQPAAPLDLALKFDSVLTDGATTMSINSLLGVSTKQPAIGNESLHILVGGIPEPAGEDPISSYGVWSVSRSGIAKLLIQHGDPAPGMPDGYTLARINRPQLDANGQLGFYGSVYEPGADVPTHHGIWSGGIDGELSLLVSIGDSIPSLPGNNEVFTSFYWPQFNTAGQTAFAGTAKDPNSSPSAARIGMGIWKETEDNVLVQVARQDEPSPGIPGGRFYVFNQSSVAINDAGQVAFQGTANSPTEYLTGIWTEGGGNGLQLVANAGGIAPGTGGGLYEVPDTPVIINDRGQTAFLGTILRPDDTVDTGIWAQDVHGDLQLIALTGELLDVSDNPNVSDMRTVTDVGFSSFNDFGQLAFWARFTDGSEGVFLSYLVSVPEPGTLLLASIACFAAMRSRRNPTH